MNFSQFIKKRQTPNNSGNNQPPSILVKAFASACYTGYCPIASGTAGSFAALLAYYFIPGLSNAYILLSIAGIVFIAGVHTAGIMEHYYGHDPAEVTIDEAVGMWVSLLFLPQDIIIAGTAFIIFRFFDIMKPFPANRFDEMRGGFGIMMDDVVSGLYTNIILQILVHSHLITIIKTLI